MSVHGLVDKRGVVGATLPTMTSFTNGYATTSDLLNLRGLSRESLQLAATHPLCVVPHRKMAKFGPLSFHSFLYSHAATRPFRPLVVRECLARTGHVTSAALLSLLLSGGAKAATALQTKRWDVVPLEPNLRAGPTASALADVPFAVIPRLRLEWSHVSENATSSAAAATAGGNSGHDTFCDEESIFSSVGDGAVCAHLQVPPGAIAFVAALNRRLGVVQPSMALLARGTLAHAARSRYDVTLHSGDALFVPRGWGVSFAKTKVSYACNANNGADTSNNADLDADLPGLARRNAPPVIDAIPPPPLSAADTRRRESWEVPSDFELLVAQRAADHRHARNEASNVVLCLRHVYRAFPELTEQQARLAMAQNLTEVASFYRPSPAVPPAVGVTGRVR